MTKRHHETTDPLFHKLSVESYANIHEQNNIRQTFCQLDALFIAQHHRNLSLLGTEMIRNVFLIDRTEKRGGKRIC